MLFHMFVLFLFSYLFKCFYMLSGFNSIVFVVIYMCLLFILFFKCVLYVS